MTFYKLASPLKAVDRFVSASSREINVPTVFRPSYLHTTGSTHRGVFNHRRTCIVAPVDHK